jgi:hypothetical protein
VLPEVGGLGRQSPVYRFVIKVTVELVSARGAERNRLLGIATIANDGRGTAARGNYVVQLSKAGARAGEAWRHGYVEGFDRKRRGGWDLLFLALRSCVGPRNLLDYGLAPSIADTELPTLELALHQVKTSAGALSSGAATPADRALMRLALELSATIDRLRAGEPLEAA